VFSWSNGLELAENQVVGDGRLDNPPVIWPAFVPVRINFDNITDVELDGLFIGAACEFRLSPFYVGKRVMQTFSENIP
jgi:hypothetical protein